MFVLGNSLYLTACLLVQKKNRRKEVQLKVLKSGRTCPPTETIPLTEKSSQRDPLTPRDTFTPKETFAPRSPVILATEQDGEDLLRPHRRIFRPDTRHIIYLLITVHLYLTLRIFIRGL